MQVLVVNYEVGNHLSITNALELLGYDYIVSRQPDEIAAADCYILPGVGAFAEAMHNIEAFGLIEPMNVEVLEKKKPILGICLGMQIMADESEEKGLHRGLGWIRGQVRRLRAWDGLRIPHVGWNSVEVRRDSPLFARVGDDAAFYFDHSYHFTCDERYVSSTAGYGCPIVASVQKENIFGVQFHPEKSQANGLKLFRGFFNHVELTQGAYAEEAAGRLSSY